MKQRTNLDNRIVIVALIESVALSSPKETVAPQVITTESVLNRVMDNVRLRLPW